MASTNTFLGRKATRLQQQRRENWRGRELQRGCNPTGTKRTWQQLKMKYKNIVQTANRKKAEARKVVEGAPSSMLRQKSLPRLLMALLRLLLQQKHFQPFHLARPNIIKRKLHQLPQHILTNSCIMNIFRVNRILFPRFIHSYGRVLLREAILWRTTHATMMPHALSDDTLSLCRHWNQDLNHVHPEKGKFNYSNNNSKYNHEV
ncbi:uncharacterized protein LOC112843779 isoform X2 [Oreochromis niloticus]|uniref:uncharacterized protein LOC112843779 isoform X2 n=1 Tax=Oreochromis niloticus TaxID=8128 RepID=UPI000DF49EDA|nr:uncharacterized protein LOC112843779 isoform X2 [Oreochromis niloticus]